MVERRNWSRDETLVAFRLYCYTPFGKLHKHNPDILRLAAALGRTASAVGMKACNFASLDPIHASRGVRGLRNRSQLEDDIWRQFEQDSEAVAAEAEAAYERLVGAAADESGAAMEDKVSDADADARGARGDTPRLTEAARGADAAPAGPTEVDRTVRARRVQSFFRSAVLTSYGGRCALTGLAVSSLLNASHIIPWAAAPARRADPTNGLCLNVLHDRAFDRGLMTFDDTFRAVVSPRLGEDDDLGALASALTGVAGRSLRLPDRFRPDAQALAHHRERLFQG